MSWKTKPARRPWLRAAAQAVLLLATGLLAACSNSMDIDLPTPQTSSTEVAFTDTLTVRTSTVQLDSVASSGTSYLLTGRYTDARLGTIAAQSFLQLGLSAAFQPEASFVYDSLVLTLTADTYRYGDTTRYQQLAVHRVQQAFALDKTYYTTDALTYDAAPLGERTFRGRAGLGTFRVNLSTSGLGAELWAAGRSGQLTTTDELQARLRGLALLPGAADDAAIVRWNAASGATTLRLYYHDPLAPAVALEEDFTDAGTDGHFFQLTADRSATPLAALTSTRLGLSSTASSDATFIQAGLGLATKLEFPYLEQLKGLGSNIVITSADLQLEVLSASENRFLPPPSIIVPRLTDRANNEGSYFSNTAGTALSVAYQRGVSSRTGLDQGLYSVSLLNYITAVLNGTVANNGILLTAATTSDATVDRVVLGSASSDDNPLKIKLYYVRPVL